MKKMCAFLLLALPLTALAYPIDVSKQFNGSEVSATAVEIDHNMVGLLLENYGKADASCAKTLEKLKKGAYRSIATTSALAISPEVNILDPRRPCPVLALGKSPLADRRNEKNRLGTLITNNPMGSINAFISTSSCSANAS